ncbi:sensor histidine kinase [Foetidibacter luteolus]|uniref:sensor histidine kinase n=1 Tax=Foetidibacter luteolus TaxID=2608880 RepID=UPI00129BB18E|nr:HAMP domain-containing sensor histidine kinase [Foetidibacter luteolus]
MRIMKKSTGLKFSHTLIIMLSTVALVTVFAFNRINNSISRNFRTTILRLESKDTNLVLLQQAKDEVTLADNQYRYFLYAGDTVARHAFIAHVTNTVNILKQVQYFDNAYIADIKTEIGKKLSVSKSLLLLKTMSDSLLRQASLNAEDYTPIANGLLNGDDMLSLPAYPGLLVDTVVIVREKKKRNIFDRIGSIFSGKKRPQDKVQQSYRKATGAGATENEKNVAAAGHGQQADKIHEYYQQILNRQRKLRNDVAAKERELAQLNLSLIGNINQGISILLEDYKLVEQQVKAAAQQKLGKLQRQKDYLVWGSAACILLFAFLLTLVLLKLGKYQRQLVEAREKSDGLALLKTRVLSTVTHEIRSPLMVMLAYAEQMKQQPADDNQAAFTDAVTQSAGHMLGMVDSILDFSKLEEGKAILHKEPFRLKNVTDHIEQAYHVAANAKGIALKVVTAFDEQVSVIGDERCLMQILYNLVSNAIKFTHKGWVEVHVSFNNTEAKQPQLTLRVKDTGEGIPDGLLDTIFEEYTQVGRQASITSARFNRGSGLGLSICRKLVLLHGGKIWAESVAGKGSVFNVTLPYGLAATAVL